jgi:DNA polymerase III alpha subunit (gram-positive type)
MSRNILEAIYLVMDTETTGVDPATDRIVEFAAVATTAQAEIARVSVLVNPMRDIPPEASAVHHLIDEDVAGAQEMMGAIPEALNTLGGGPFDAMVAHNAPFDSAFLVPLGPQMKGPWLDTLRLAKRLRPALEVHTNEALRYREGITYEGIRDEVPHRAMHDARVTAALLRIYLQEVEKNRADLHHTVEELIADINKPMVLSGNIQFGKWKGTPWFHVDRGYLTWITKQPDMDMDVRCTARHHLGWS